MLTVCRQLLLILFSVSMAWSMYNLLDQYPRIHRFGHTWDRWVKKRGGWRKKTRKWDDMVIVIICWFPLAGLVMLSLYSLSRVWEGITNLANTAGMGVLFWLISGLLAFAYLFIPYLINRLLWSLSLIVVPEDFRGYVDDTHKKKQYLLQRFSSETIDTLYQRTRRRGFFILVDSALKLLLFTLLPPLVLVWHPLRIWLIFVVLVVAIALSLVLTIPYGKWLDGRAS